MSFSYIASEMITGAARTLFCLEWADWAEFAGINLSGCEISNVAPPTPPNYVANAAYLIGQIVAMNTDRGDARSLVQKAVEADNMLMEDWSGHNSEHFGSDLAMMALGHGVSWFDDHNKFDLKLPFGWDQDGWPDDMCDPFYKDCKVKHAHILACNNECISRLVVPVDWDEGQVLNRVIRFDLYGSREATAVEFDS